LQKESEEKKRKRDAAVATSEERKKKKSAEEAELFGAEGDITLGTNCSDQLSTGMSFRCASDAPSLDIFPICDFDEDLLTEKIVVVGFKAKGEEDLSKGLKKILQDIGMASVVLGESGVRFYNSGIPMGADFYSSAVDGEETFIDLYRVYNDEEVEEEEEDVERLVGDYSSVKNGDLRSEDDSVVSRQFLDVATNFLAHKSRGKKLGFDTFAQRSRYEKNLALFRQLVTT